MSVPFPPAPEPPKPTGKVCTKCEQFKPLDEFHAKKTSSDGHASQCKECYNAASRASTAAYKQLHAAMGGNTKLSAPHVTELCDKIIQKFGGLDGFVDYWHSQIERAREKSPGGKLVLDSLNHVSKLVVMSTEHRGSAPDTSDLSDADLEREFNEVGEKVMLKIHKDSQDPPPSDDKQSA